MGAWSWFTNRSEISRWNFMQGLLYCTAALVLLIYPQILDLFLKDLTNDNYKTAQLAATPLFVIGGIFIYGTIPEYSKTLLFIKILKYPSSPSDYNNMRAEYTFAGGSVLGRCINVPLVIMYALLTFANGNTFLTFVSCIFIIIDPLMGLMTLFMLKKYNPQNSKWIQNNNNNNNNETNENNNNKNNNNNKYYFSNRSEIARWNVIQGLFYCIAALSFMVYPQVLDLFIKDLTNNDYKTAQLAATPLFVIGCMFFYSSMPELSIYLIFVKLLKYSNECINNYNFNNNNNSDYYLAPEYIFAASSIIGRCIVVPIVIIIDLLTFANGNEFLTFVLCIILIIDPISGLNTLFLLKKYDPQNSKLTKNNDNNQQNGDLESN